MTPSPHNVTMTLIFPKMVWTSPLNDMHSEIAYTKLKSFPKEVNTRKPTSITIYSNVEYTLFSIHCYMYLIIIKVRHLTQQ